MSRGGEASMTQENRTCCDDRLNRLTPTRSSRFSQLRRVQPGPPLLLRLLLRHGELLQVRSQRPHLPLLPRFERALRARAHGRAQAVDDGEQVGGVGREGAIRDRPPVSRALFGLRRGEGVHGHWRLRLLDRSSLVRLRRPRNVARRCVQAQEHHYVLRQDGVLPASLQGLLLRCCG